MGYKFHIDTVDMVQVSPDFYHGYLKPSYVELASKKLKQDWFIIPFLIINCL